MTQIEQFDHEQMVGEIILADLGIDSQALFIQIQSIENGWTLLHFLDANANTLYTVDDIAYHLSEPQASVDRGLHALEGLGLVREVEVAGCGLFGITRDRERQHVLQDLRDWQERWHARLARIRLVLDGKG